LVEEATLMKRVALDPASPRLDEVVAWVTEHGEPVAVQGEAGAVVVVPADAYEEFERLRADRRRGRAAAGADLQRLADEVGERNADLSDAEIEALADRATRDAVDGLVAKGRLRFEP
jgi:PHD/YefM family antitoxin component YafN of YafNO toxin-antitoxin module